MLQTNMLQRRKVKKESGVQTTHSEVESKVVEQAKKVIEEKSKDFIKTTKSSKKQSTKKHIKTMRFSDEEHENINKYLKKNDISFADLVRDLLSHNNII